VNVGKAAGGESKNGTEVTAVVKWEVESVEGEGVHGRRVACTFSRFVSNSASSFVVHCLLGLLTIPKPAHRQHILISLLSRQMIYLT
jgi:hypothetical protein